MGGTDSAICVDLARRSAGLPMTFRDGRGLQSDDRRWPDPGGYCTRSSQVNWPAPNDAGAELAPRRLTVQQPGTGCQKQHHPAHRSPNCQ
jgi:hypothetical protein